MSSSSQQVVIVGRDPTPRRRLDENKPEERRSLILAALEASAATIEHANPTEGSAALLTLSLSLSLTLTLALVLSLSLSLSLRLSLSLSLTRFRGARAGGHARDRLRGESRLPAQRARPLEGGALAGAVVRVARDRRAGRPRAKAWRAPKN